jgi:hypothetical protein
VLPSVSAKTALDRGVAVHQFTQVAKANKLTAIDRALNEVISQTDKRFERVVRNHQQGLLSGLIVTYRLKMLL